MMFWILAMLLLAVCVAALAAGLRTVSRSGESPDVGVYRDQLRELDRDAERGVLAPEEAEAARTEVSRRLLAADRAGPTPMRGPGHRWLGLALVAVPIIGISLATYLAIGAPGYPDLPLAGRIAQVEAARAARPSQDAAEAQALDRIDTSDAEVTAMATQLAKVLAERPDDLRGWKIAVQTQSRLGDLEAAWRSQARVIALLADAATAEDLSLQAELMVMAAGGYVSPEAEQVLDEAARRDPESGIARYYAGLMYAQQGRPDLAWGIWRGLIADSRPDSPWLDPIYAQIEAVSAAAGEPTPLSELPQPRGPTAGAVAASGDMSPEDRVQMVQGMVDGLAARLADQGGPVEDWARLITSYGVLGRTEDAGSIYEEGKAVFADEPGALDTLARAAENAGLAP